MKVAYLVNQYPQPSQSFIRREIRAHEQAGWIVARFTVRRFNGKLVDPNDVAERDQANVLLGGGKLSLLTKFVKTFFRSPKRFLPALRTAIRNGRTADRGGVFLHLIYLAEACVLLDRVTAKQIDHVHAHFGTNSTTVAMLCRLLGGPTFSFTVHGPEEFDRARGDGLALSDKLQHARFGVVISNFGRGQLMRWTRSQDWPKIKIVRCGIDSTFLDAPPSPVPANDRVVCVGRIVEQKAQLILVEAVKLLRDRGIRINLRLIGDGPMRPQVETLVSRYGLGDRVDLLGSRSADDVRQEMLASRVVAQPSLAEGLPVAIMEAMALRRPVVTTQIAGIPELVDSTCGYLVAAGSAEQLADALADAMGSDDPKLTRMGEVGRERVIERHRADDQARILRELFEHFGINGDKSSPGD